MVEREWPVTTIRIYKSTDKVERWIPLSKEWSFIFRLDDPNFLVSIFRLYRLDFSIDIFSIDKVQETPLKEVLLTGSHISPIWPFSVWFTNAAPESDFSDFGGNLFWFSLLDDAGYDKPFLEFHCEDKVPDALKNFITNNRLESYLV